MKVREIKDYLNSLYPFSNKCEWDNCGLLVGDENDEVKKIGFTLDLTSEAISQAVKENVNLIITHHPVIFHSQKTFLSGNIAYEAAIKGVSVISCHTCYDSAKGGVSEILAETIGLTDIETVETEEKPFCVRKGKINAVSSSELAQIVSSKLGTTVRLILSDKEITTVAVCGGAGGDFIEEVFHSGAQAYVTGDISHHEALLAAELGLTLIAAGHFETEVISMQPMLEKVQAAFERVECIMLRQNNPITFVSAEG